MNVGKIVEFMEGVKSKCELSIDINVIKEHLYKDMPESISYSDLLIYTASYVANFISDHYDYDIIAANLVLKELELKTKNTYAETLEELKENNLINDKYYKCAIENIDLLETLRLKYVPKCTYFGAKTLVKSYLLKKNKKVIERIPDLYIRTALSVSSNDIENMKKTFDLLADGVYTHATPTLYNAGTKCEQLASCFLLGTSDDLGKLFKTLSDIALISKRAGGIGIHLHNVRAEGTLISGTNGISDGIIPYIMVINFVARYVNQGGNRKGAFAVYLEPWHADFPKFIKLRLNTGDVNERARDIFTAVWMNDLFMERVRNGEDWSLMCPHICPNLYKVHGEEFRKLYCQYEKEQKYVKKVKARELWYDILQSQIETGTPYMMYKDAINAKSNQSNLGTIRSSNLCCEIVEYSDEDEYAVCNLVSIALPKCVTKNGYDFQKLYEVSRIVTRNLNNIIDLNYYPVEETRKSNLKHRPIGIGVQGLYDVFMEMKIPYESQEAIELNKKMFETIYFASLSESCELAKKYGTYASYEGSPMSKGMAQFHLWDVKPSDLWDWSTLMADIKKYGVRNSLLTTCMPTASTSQILGNTESIEPQASNIYTRETQVGSFVVVNKYLMKDLMDLKLWNKNMKDKIIYYNGSIQNIDEIPKDIKRYYKTTTEIDLKYVMDHALTRGPFIDQTQSMNLYMEAPDFKKMSAMHFYGWSRGIKTGMYYFRSRPASDTTKFNLDINTTKELDSIKKEKELCSRLNRGACDMCSS